LGYSVTGALANAGGLDLAYWIGTALDAAALFTAWRVVPPAPPGRQDRLDVAGALLLGAARCSSGGSVSPIRADTAQHRLRLRGTLVVAGLVLVPFSATSYLARRPVASLVRRTSHEFVLPLFPGVLLGSMVRFSLARSTIWEIVVIMGVAGLGVELRGSAVVGLAGCLLWALSGAAAILLPLRRTDAVVGRHEIVQSADTLRDARSGDRDLRQVQPPRPTRPGRSQHPKPRGP
jgi:hypothetical protein